MWRSQSCQGTHIEIVEQLYEAFGGAMAPRRAVPAHRRNRARRGRHGSVKLAQEVVCDVELAHAAERTAEDAAQLDVFRGRVVQRAGRGADAAQRDAHVMDRIAFDIEHAEPLLPDEVDIPAGEFAWSDDGHAICDATNTPATRYKCNVRRDSGRGNGRPVGRHDLRLIREDLAVADVDAHLQPVHIVVAVGLVIAEGLDARKILEPLARHVQQRLVDAEVVRVARSEEHTSELQSLAYL